MRRGRVPPVFWPSRSAFTWSAASILTWRWTASGSQCGLPLFFFGCTFVAAYISINRAAIPGLQENGADRGLLLLSGWLGVLLLASDGIDTPERLRILLRRAVMAATAMAALGAVEFFTGLDIAQYISIPGLTVHAEVTDLVSRAGFHRVSATAAQPLELAAVLAMSLPLAIHQARFAPARLRRRRWLQVGIIASAALMTVSRSTVVALAVIALVLLPTWPKRERHRAYFSSFRLGLPGLAGQAEYSQYC